MADEITRNEVYLSAIAEGSSDVPEPITREEQYLAKIAGADVGIPEKAITRKEQYYKKIVDNGGGGGGDLSPKLTVNLTSYNSGARLLNGGVPMENGVIYIDGGHLVISQNPDTVLVQSGQSGTGTVSVPLLYNGSEYSTELSIYQLFGSTEFLQLESVLFSNEVNCTVEEDEYIIITDITKDASISIDATYKPMT